MSYGSRETRLRGWRNTVQTPETLPPLVTRAVSHLPRAKNDCGGSQSGKGESYEFKSTYLDGFIQNKEPSG